MGTTSSQHCLAIHFLFPSNASGSHFLLPVTPSLFSPAFLVAAPTYLSPSQQARANLGTCAKQVNRYPAQHCRLTGSHPAKSWLKTTQQQEVWRYEASDWWHAFCLSLRGNVYTLNLCSVTTVVKLKLNSHQDKVSLIKPNTPVLATPRFNQRQDAADTAVYLNAWQQLSVYLCLTLRINYFLSTVILS